MELGQQVRGDADRGHGDSRYKAVVYKCMRSYTNGVEGGGSLVPQNGQQHETRLKGKGFGGFPEQE